jgi:RNA polymerase sigma factor (TIGR02999 family)
MLDQDQRLDFDELFSLVYEELLRIASAMRRNESHSTLGATALVHETWLKLKDYPQFAATSPMHFKRIAARVIRQVLIEAARERNALKRGGPGSLRVTLDDSLEAFEESTLELLEVDQALNQLTEADPRQAQVAELKIFSELSSQEIADEMGMSLSSVERSWRSAKAWLKTRMSGAS